MVYNNDISAVEWKIQTHLNQKFTPTRMKIGIILASFAAGCEYSEHPQHAKCMSDCTSEMAECSKQCEPDDAQCQSECARDLITCENGK